MGVEGLWGILQPTETTVSLESLGVNGFATNYDGHRGFRLGIDASIWFHQVSAAQRQSPQYQKIGLQILFMRCARLLAMPMVLPLFVFDGPDRPKFKRGSPTSHRDSPYVTPMKQMVHAFGFEYCFAPGEAEAELAYLNSIGSIDAVMTDDVDAFLFGAVTVIRSHGSNLNSGSTMTQLPQYNTTSFERESVGLTRAGLILIALLSGGDYDAGVDRIGIVVAHGLAKCGFGETLLSALELEDEDERENTLMQWRESVRFELRTNSQNNLPKKQPSLSRTFPEDFPPKDIARYYTNPVISGPSGNAHSILWRRDPDISDLASFAEEHFSWGHIRGVLERFRSKIWRGVALRMLRHAALWTDELALQQKTQLFTTTLEAMSASPLRRLEIRQLLANTAVVPGDPITSIRAEISPDHLQQFGKLAAAGISGTRPDTSINSDAVETKRRRALPAVQLHISTLILKSALPETLLALTNNGAGSSLETDSSDLENLSRKRARVSPSRVTGPSVHLEAGSSNRDTFTIPDTQAEDNAVVVLLVDGNLLRMVDGVIDLT